MHLRIEKRGMNFTKIYSAPPPPSYNMAVDSVTNFKSTACELLAAVYFPLIYAEWSRHLPFDTCHSMFKYKRGCNDPTPKGNRARTSCCSIIFTCSKAPTHHDQGKRTIVRNDWILRNHHLRVYSSVFQPSSAS